MTKKEIKFLKKLHKLYKKYNIAVGACGCCSSPFLVGLKHSEHAYSYIKHLSDGEIKSIKPFDMMSYFIRRGPKLPKLPKVSQWPYNDINIASNDPELISKVQRKIDELD